MDAPFVPPADGSHCGGTRMPTDGTQPPASRPPFHRRTDSCKAPHRSPPDMHKKTAAEPHPLVH